MPRIPKPGQRKYTIQHMWERHHQMARLLLLGYGNQEVAELLGCSPQNVSDVRNSPIFLEKLEALRERADEAAISIGARLEKGAHRSLALLEQIRDGEATNDIKLRAQVAQDLLDRAGHGKIQKVEGRHAIAHLDAEALERIKRLAHERSRAREAEAAEPAEPAEPVEAEVVEEAAS